MDGKPVQRRRIPDAGAKEEPVAVAAEDVLPVDPAQANVIRRAWEE